MIDRRQQRARSDHRRGIRRRSRPGRPPAASRRARAPCAPAGSRPRRSRPARASRVASTSPASSLRSRVSRLPRRRRPSRRSGPARQQLGAAAQRGRADHGALRQLGDPAGALARDQHVARIGARQHRADRQARRQPGRQVLHRVHRKIDPAVEQRRLELLAEQPLAAELGERPVDHAIAGRADHHDLERARLGERRDRPRRARGTTSSVWTRASGEPRVPMRTTRGHGPGSARGNRPICCDHEAGF